LYEIKEKEKKKKRRKTTTKNSAQKTVLALKMVLNLVCFIKMSGSCNVSH
jgi:hypothetical protein